MSCFNKALIVTGLFVISFLTNSQAQKNEWLIEPIITDAKNFMRIIPEVGLIELVDKDKQKGVKNFRNEVIIPMEYSHISVFTEKNYIAGNKGRTQFAWDHDGYEIEVSSEVQSTSSSLAEIKVKNAEFLEEFNGNNSGFEVLKLDEQGTKYILVNYKGDTLFHKMYLAYDFKFLMNKYIARRMSDGYTRVLNKEGEVFFETKSSTSFEENINDTGLLLIKEKLRHLYDENMNPIHTNLNSIDFFPEMNVYSTRVDKDVFLYDENHEKINSTAAKYVSLWKEDSPLLIIGMENKSIIYNTATGEKIEKAFYIYNLNKKGSLQIVQNDTLYGVYDFENDQQVIPVKYRTIRQNGTYFLANTEKFNRKTKKHINQIVLNQDGQVVLEQLGKGMKALTMDAFVFVDTAGISHLYDKNISLIMSSDEEQKIMTTKHSRWLGIEKENQRKDYYIPDLLEGKKAKSYFRIGDTFKAVEDGPEAITLVKDEQSKYGAIDSDGELVIPIKYDSIEEKYIDKQKYLKVVIDGKLGIMKRP